MKRIDMVDALAVKIVSGKSTEDLVDFAYNVIFENLDDLPDNELEEKYNEYFYPRNFELITGD